MNYGEVVSEILQIIPLPNKEPLIRSKVNQIIRYLAGTGDYFRALQEVTIAEIDGVDPASYIQAITQPSTFRALLYVAYPENISNAEIKTRTVKDVLHLQQCGKADNIAYVSGDKIRIKHNSLTPTFNLGYYSYPDFIPTDGTGDLETNWILDAVPGLVVDLTASYLLNLNGDNEDSNNITRVVQSMQLPYLQSQITGAIVQ